MAETELSKKLLKIRNKLRLSQSGMARLIAPEEIPGIYRARVSQYERGTRIPALPQILAYARAGKVNLENLIDDKRELEF